MPQSRDSIDDQYKWNIDEIYEDEDDIEREFDEIRNLLSNIEEYEGEVNDKQSLKEMIQTYVECSRKINKLSAYSRLKYNEDQENSDAQLLLSRKDTLWTEYKEKTNFIKFEIQDMGEEKIDQYIEEDDYFDEIGYYLTKIIDKKPHTKSKEVEKALNSVSEFTSDHKDIFKILSNDIDYPSVEKDGKSIEITNANLTKLLENDDREFRKEVVDKYYGTLGDYHNTFGKTLSQTIKRNVKMAEMKNYNSALEMSLKPRKIPIEVYTNLVKTVGNNLNTLHDHLNLRKDILGVDKLKKHDLYVPLPDSEDPDITYDEAKEIVLGSVEPLGEAYQEKIKEGFNEGWVDVYENENKSYGAFSSGSYDTKPYILMNYKNNIKSLYTLAHELGHSAHSELTNENQHFLNSHYDIFVAEVASNVNETLLTDYIFENCDNRIKEHALAHQLENYRGVIYAQTLFADFEKSLYSKVESGEPINSKKMSEIYLDLQDKYYEPCEIDEKTKYNWMRVPHFYRGFYVYQYVTGKSAAIQLANNIENDNTEYLKFLKSGGSRPPLELLERAGVNMKSTKPIEEAITKYGDNIERFRKTID